MDKKTVRVGVGVFALNSQNKFVLGQRIGSHGASMRPPRSLTKYLPRPLIRSNLFNGKEGRKKERILTP